MVYIPLVLVVRIYLANPAQPSTEPTVVSRKQRVWLITKLTLLAVRLDHDIFLTQYKRHKTCGPGSKMTKSPLNHDSSNAQDLGFNDSQISPLIYN